MFVVVVVGVVDESASSHKILPLVVVVVGMVVAHDDGTLVQITLAS